MLTIAFRLVAMLLSVFSRMVIALLSPLSARFSLAMLAVLPSGVQNFVQGRCLCRLHFCYCNSAQQR